jgi:hypothetical protein
MLNTETARELAKADATFGYQGKTDSYALWELSEQSYRRMATFALDNRGFTVEALSEGLCLQACRSNSRELADDPIAETIYQDNPAYWQRLADEVSHFVELHG